ncbi:glycoside hydrolase family 92 protein [Venturia nashicola]|uniref:Glycoside hydrolase family 92 protein n=1 Tax=Venturia nashicola TaxID=86259 RepID=A0A4Z1PHL8_9PEZI|nr:glycoside hydrolase family 92 protein [Venturia nashicola]
MSCLLIQLCWLLIGLKAVAASAGFDYVRPLIGTVNGGHVFPGATLPFGMAKAVADVKGENQGGFGSDFSNITGFSHMHDSGTGGVASLGNFPIFPFTGCPNDNLTLCDFSNRGIPHINGSVDAHPGYFALTLVSDIKAEMTVTNHTALYRFTFPKSDPATKAVIITELNDLPLSASSTALIHDNSTGRISGNGSFAPSFGPGQYNLHFCADFKGARVSDVGLFSGSEAKTYDADGKLPESFWPQGGFTRFVLKENRQILVRVGVSFISIEQACGNAESEIPDFDFAKTLSAAEEAWKVKLDVIEVDDRGVSDELKEVFWSGIYRSLISPQDYTGENPLWKSDEPYYDSFYCIWDSFRAQHPLITLIDPHSQTLMVRSLIDIYRFEGKLPDCRMSLSKGWSQGGSNADVLLADAFVKGLRQDIDWTTGYEAVLSDAEVEPARWDLEGRGGLRSWKDLGYIPIDDQDGPGSGMHTRSISRTVEYAYNDFCVGEIARGLNHTEDYEKYMNRSQNWENLYNTNQTSAINGIDTGFVGSLQPRFYNQSWAYQDPILCSPLLDPNACFLDTDGHETYEGSCWLYNFFVPGDMASLISKLDGRESFVKRLDFLHESGLLYLGDEQSFLTPFLYHYAGRPGLSAARAHTYIPSQFNNTLIGIPGNDDSGAMGAFASLTMMGIFPNAGQNVYFITPPFFREVKLRNPQTKNVATIRNVNFDASYKNVFIQKATLNGVPYTKNWIDHAFFLDGGVLELTLGDKESKWGTDENDVPPSFSTTGPPNGTSVSPTTTLKPPVQQLINVWQGSFQFIARLPSTGLSWSLRSLCCL